MGLSRSLVTFKSIRIQNKALARRCKRTKSSSITGKLSLNRQWKKFIEKKQEKYNSNKFSKR